MFTLEGAAGSLDPTWDNIGAAIWSLVELGVSIIASSLPTLRPLLSRLLPGLGLSTGGGHRTSYYIRHDGGGSTRGTKRGSVLNKLPTTVATPSRDRSTATDASTEDLALERTSHAGAGGTRGSFHAGASSGCDSAGFASEDPERAGRIVMTTEITVDSGRR